MWKQWSVKRSMSASWSGRSVDTGPWEIRELQPTSDEPRQLSPDHVVTLDCECCASKECEESERLLHGDYCSRSVGVYG